MRGEIKYEKKEYDRLIQQLDDILEEHRLEWLECKNPSEKKRWMKAIDSFLAQRYRLAAKRDSEIN